MLKLYKNNSMSIAIDPDLVVSVAKNEANWTTIYLQNGTRIITSGSVEDVYRALYPNPEVTYDSGLS